MTPKQFERLQKKITDIKRTLASEKRKFGGYDDSRGLRYMPTKYFLQLADYPGGLKYTKWFTKAFPDDGGNPEFLLEWTIILFKTGNTKAATRKAFETYCANTYFFDKFFNRSITPIVKWEGSNLQRSDYADFIDYSSESGELADFAKWLDELTKSEKFVQSSKQFIEIEVRLKTETDREIRHNLIMQSHQLQESF